MDEKVKGIEELRYKVIDERLRSYKIIWLVDGESQDASVEVEFLLSSLEREKERAEIMKSVADQLVEERARLLSLLSEKEKKIEDIEQVLHQNSIETTVVRFREKLRKKDRKIEELVAAVHRREDAWDKAEARIKSLEEDYQRIIKEIPECDPIPASQRSDDQLEPPWEVFARIRTRVKFLEEGAAEIAEGKGRYDLDNHQHAINTIEDMKAIANKLLEKK